MRNRVLVLLSAVTLLMVVVGASALVLAQAQSGAATPNVKSGGTANTRIVWDPTAPPPTNWTPPRTPWGDPDLRGYYLNLSYTPLQRPQALAGKAMYSTEEAVEAFKKSVALDAEVDPTTIHYDWKEYGMDQWQSPVRPNRRTSLIVDPPDGRIPPMLEEARKRREAAAAIEKAKGNDVRSPGTYTRCVTGNGGPPRVPGGVTAESQITQAPGYVVQIIEANNDVRIIPLDGRPHLPTNVKGWLGDARGHFEGNTLVVETTNFRPDRVWQGATDNLRLVERFTMADARTLKYEFTVTDPTTWARPWSVEAPLPKIEPPLYEFACHEQNYGLINWTTGMLVRDKEGIGQSGRAPVFSEEDGGR